MNTIRMAMGAAIAVGLISGTVYAAGCCGGHAAEGAAVAHDGQETVARADAYGLDKDHTTVGFNIRHMGITNVRGLFGAYDGEVKIKGDDIRTLKVNATIQAASMDTNNQRRDDHLRSPDFFEVETWPEITFRSSSVVSREDGYALVGDLTMKDVTKEVMLPVTMSGPVEDPWGGSRIGLEIKGSVNRHDFGVASDGAADRLIGANVEFDIHVQAIKQ